MSFACCYYLSVIVYWSPTFHELKTVILLESIKLAMKRIIIFNVLHLVVGWFLKC